MMFNHEEVKLGKAAPRHDPRTLKLAAYLPAVLPQIPASANFYSRAQPAGNWGMMLNDQFGCCTCSAAGHMIEAWTGDAGVLVVPPDDTILAAYEGACGYNPADPSTDRGGVEIDVLNYWRKVGVAGHKIGAYAAVNIRNQDHVRAGAYLFGGLYAGVQLPNSVRGASVWTVVGDGMTGASAAGSWGGHAVPVVGFDAEGVWVVTWGALTRVTWQFWAVYFDEAYAIISSDFLNAAGETSGGFNLTQLQSDLQAVTN